MKLFYHPGLSSLFPHIILHETGLDFTLVNVDLQNKRTELGTDYCQITSKGQVPALELDDGTVLTEGVAIVQYLSDLKPDRKLLAPEGCPGRYQTLEWLNFIATELHKSFDHLVSDAAPETYKQHIAHQLGAKLAWVNGQLEGKQWLMGAKFSVADAYLFTVVRWAQSYRLDIKGLTALASWFERVAARPAVGAALQAEGL